ncbi:ribosomal-protein-alanine N-acetyltransferase, partial [Candidatus Poribacteria bacterium]|nr:ribosomal-protein-alanine N-acetyltransferase [Candidatus Poribacteria bacterium]
DKVIGYIVFYVFSGEGHILNIAIDTGYRRRGIGKYLLEFALEIIKKNDVEEVYLEVSVKNTAALELYKKYQFQVFGVRKRYYSNGDDAYVLCKEMNDE